MIGVRPWGLAPDEEAELFRQLRFRYFKWDTFACGERLVLSESLVLDRCDHELIVRTVEGLDKALRRFEARVCQEPEALRLLGIPPAVHPLVMADPPAPLQCARYDLFPTEDGRWMVSEFNEDVPGGFNEAAGIPDLLGDPGAGLHWEGDLRERFREAFEPYESVAFLYATAYSEDLQHMLVLEDWLRSRGHRTVLASPEHLEGGWTARWRRPRFQGESVDAAFRFYPGEWMARLPNLPDWHRWASRLPMMNPFRSLVRQSKSVFALWREDGLLSTEDRALVEAHCPHTEGFRPKMVERLRDERDRWVLKRSFGRMGDSVVLGSLSTDKEWAGAISEALAEPGVFCAQKCFRVQSTPFASGPLYPAIGAYLVNGRFAGYYSRAAARPLITHEAYHVATLVRAA